MMYVPPFLSATRRRFVHCAALLASLIPDAALAAPQVEEVARLDGTSAFAIHELVETSGGTFFAATDGIHGRELWFSDSTAEGTGLVKDIVPGSTGSNARELVVLDDTLYFVATVGASDYQLWKSDGTEAGTQRVVLDQVAFSRLTVFNGALYFQAGSPIGTGLWRSDGTPEGTERMIEMVGQNHTVSGSYLYFTGSDPSYGNQLFRTDGTAGGTVRLTEIGTSGYNLVGMAFADVNGTLFFLARHTTTNTAGVYKSDGTVAGTVKITGSISPYEWQGSYGAAVNGKYVFSSAPTGDENGNVELYVSDGTAAGTVLLKEIRSGLAGSYPADFVSDGSRVYFRAITDTQGGEVWVSDGTAAGTIILADAYPGIGSSYRERSLVISGSRAFFVARTGNNQDYELWTSAGTAATTARVKDIGPDLTSGIPASNDALHPVSGGRVWFAGFDGSARGLWTSDGSEANTSALVSPLGNGAGLHPRPGFPVTIGDLTFFVGQEYAAGQELWVTDGTSAGTQLLADVRTGFAGGAVSFVGIAGDKLIFSADDGTTGIEPWVTDGTPAGTQLLLDVYSGATSSNPGVGIAFNGELLFQATDPTNGVELWKTDGTIAGTQRITDIGPGTASSSPQNFLELDGRIYFVATDGSTGLELWVTDGTPAGTTRITNVDGGSGHGVQYNAPLTALGSRILFAGYTSANGIEPWITDGTEAGTYRLADIEPGTTSSSVTSFAVAGNQAFFFAWNSASGMELWATDGSVENTRMVIDLVPGPTGSAGSIVGVDGDDVIFMSGAKLYRSGGTAAGTHLVSPPGTSVFTALNTPQGIFFVGHDSVNGAELWVSDGVTEEGATRLSTFTAGTSDPRIAYKGSVDSPGLVAVPGGVLFHVLAADDGTGIHFSNGTVAGTGRLSLGGRNTFILQAIAVNNPALAIVSDEGGGALWKMTFNTAPAVNAEIPDSNGTQNDAFSYDVSAHFSDAEGDDITYSASGLPEGLSIDSTTGVISGQLTNAAAMASRTTVTVTATDAAGDSVSTTFDIVVANVNDAPLPVDDTAATAEDTTVIIDVLANDSDPDGDALIVTGIIHDSLAGESAFIEILSGGTSIAVTPFFDSTAPIEFSYSVSDGEDTADADVTVTINPINDAPQFSSVTPTSVIVDEPYSVVANVSDPEGDATTVSATTLPNWLSFDAGTLELSGTPSLADLGEHDVVLVASDGVDDGEYAFTLTVIEPTDAGLSVTLVPLVDSVVTGEDVAWTATVANAGPADANSPLLVVRIDHDGLENVTWPGGCTPLEHAGGDKAECALAPIASGGGASLQFLAKSTLVEDAFAFAQVSSERVDPAADDDTAGATVNVTRTFAGGPAAIIGADAASSVALGDLDGDDDADLVVGTIAGKATAVYLNDGAGGYARSGTLGDSALTRGIALADVNADGQLDIVLANNGANAVYLNQGGAKFARVATLGAKDSYGAALADLDADGDLDLVFADDGAGSDVYANNGAGGFTHAVTLATQNARDVAVADVNGDEHVDAAFAQHDDGGRLFNGTATLAFSSGANFGTAGGAAIATGLLDGDAIADLVLARGLVGDTAPLGAVFRGTGSGPSKITDFGRAQSRDVLLLDVDGGGALDVLVVGANGNHRIHLSDGAGGFEMHDVLIASAGNAAAAAADVDGDGDMDMAFANPDGGVDLYLNGGAGGIGVHRADLSVTATLDTANPSANAPISWTVRVANAGPDGVPGAALTVSGTVALNIVTVQGAGDCSASAGEWRCELTTLARAGDAVFTVSAQASAGSHTLSASVTSTTDDPATANNDAKSGVTVRAAGGSDSDSGGGGGGGAWSWPLAALGLLRLARARRQIDA